MVRWARLVVWVVPVHPTLGVWLVVLCLSAALDVYARAMSWAPLRAFTGVPILCVPCGVYVATWRLFTSLRVVCGTRLVWMASSVSPHPVSFCCLLVAFFFFVCFCFVFFLFFSVACLVLSCFGFCFFFFFFRKQENWKSGAQTLQAPARAIGEALQHCYNPRCGARCGCLPGGCAPRVRLWCRNVHSCQVVWVRLGVSLRLGYTPGRASERIR